MLPASFGNAVANFRAESIAPHRRVTYLPKRSNLLCPVPSGPGKQKLAIDTESEPGGSSPGALTPNPCTVYLSLGTSAFILEYTKACINNEDA